MTVSALNRYLKAKIDQDIQLQSIMIKGEISNLRYHRSGHVYFTLKDETASIKAVMFASNAKKLKISLKDGDKVYVEANTSVYQISGECQLIVKNVELEGVGALFLQFEQLKQKLAKEGLFDEGHKKSIPSFPTKIAVLSSYPSAALMDVVRTIKSRFPIVRIVIFPIPVQGKDAYKEIMKTLRYVDTLKFHTIIIARGGGTIEQRWNFNEEDLARTIYQCQTPIISGVGHEIDFTICDFVSDLRTATPTYAAMAATPDIKELEKNVAYYQYNLKQLMNHIISVNKKQIEQIKSFYLFKNPEKLFADYHNQIVLYQDKLLNSFKYMLLSQKNLYYQSQKSFIHLSELLSLKMHNQLDSINDRLNNSMKQSFKHRQEQFYYTVSKLNALSALKTLERGYSIVLKDNKNINSIHQLKPHDEIEIHLKDGHCKAQIK